MARSRRLSLERLEDRWTPATSGVTWPDGQHLTLSFVPDGTPLGNTTSSLFKTLNAVAPTAVWQREILRAFQAWAGNVNVNVGVVPDSGQPLGTGGAVQATPSSATSASPPPRCRRTPSSPTPPSSGPAPPGRATWS